MIISQSQTKMKGKGQEFRKTNFLGEGDSQKQIMMNECHSGN